LQNSEIESPLNLTNSGETLCEIASMYSTIGRREKGLPVLPVVVALNAESEYYETFSILKGKM
jgi:hypothetical protein